jgi:DNA uptake protein ComE-like DNA-binding protein
MKWTLRIASFVAALALATSLATAGTSIGKRAVPNTSSAAKSTTLAKVPLVDINSASRDELVRVPGIGEAIADHIIAGRPWKQKSDLLAKGVANKAQYAKMRSHIIAKQK